MIRVIRDAAGLIFIDGRPDPIAGGLQASASGDQITIANTQGGRPIVCADFGQIADVTGAGFATATAALSYLETVFSPPPAHTVAAVAAADIVAGKPLAISRASGQLVAACADTYAQAFVAGLAMTNVAAGFVAQAGRGAVTLADWTAIIGSSSLQSGQAYFLAPAGGLSTEAIATGAVCVARVGLAASSTTLIVTPSDPILL